MSWEKIDHFSEELGPRFLPKPTTAVTKRRLYCMRLCARPRGCFFLSCFATFGVCPLTFPARASDPCTLPKTSNQKLTISVAIGMKREISSSSSFYPWWSLCFCSCFDRGKKRGGWRVVDSEEGKTLAAYVSLLLEDSSYYLWAFLGNRASTGNWAFDF